MPRYLSLRISELCALDGEDLDFACRRIHVPRLRTRDDARIVRVQGIKTEAAERVIPMLPAAYLIGHADPGRIMRVYQQALDMGDAGVETLETVIGCTADAVTLLVPPGETASQPDAWSELEGAETAW